MKNKESTTYQNILQNIVFDGGQIGVGGVFGIQFDVGVARSTWKQFVKDRFDIEAAPEKTSAGTTATTTNQRTRSAP